MSHGHARYQTPTLRRTATHGSPTPVPAPQAGVSHHASDGQLLLPVTVLTLFPREHSFAKRLHHVAAEEYLQRVFAESFAVPPTNHWHYSARLAYVTGC